MKLKKLKSLQSLLSHILTHVNF